jgi:hypothetical protein
MEPRKGETITETAAQKRDEHQGQVGPSPGQGSQQADDTAEKSQAQDDQKTVSGVTEQSSSEVAKQEDLIQQTDPEFCCNAQLLQKEAGLKSVSGICSDPTNQDSDLEESQENVPAPDSREQVESTEEPEVKEQDSVEVITLEHQISQTISEVPHEELSIADRQDGEAQDEEHLTKQDEKVEQHRQPADDLGKEGEVCGLAEEWRAKIWIAEQSKDLVTALGDQLIAVTLTKEGTWNIEKGTSPLITALFPMPEMKTDIQISHFGIVQERYRAVLSHKYRGFLEFTGCLDDSFVGNLVAIFSVNAWVA